MKRLLLTIPLFFLLTLTSWAQDVCNRHSEPTGGFSLCAPAGWSVTEREGQKFKIIFGMPGEVFTPNINFKDEANSASLADYAGASIKYIQDNYQKLGATSIKLVSREDFLTTDKISGIKAIFSTEFKGHLVRTLQYYFNKTNGQKLIVTCTALEAEKATLDPVFERALKSFQLDK
jgi:hypothetical protein